MALDLRSAMIRVDRRRSASIGVNPRQSASIRVNPSSLACQSSLILNCNFFLLAPPINLVHMLLKE